MNKNALKQKYKKQNKYIIELTDEVEVISDQVDTLQDIIDTINDNVESIKEAVIPEEPEA